MAIVMWYAYLHVRLFFELLLKNKFITTKIKIYISFIIDQIIVSNLLFFV